MGTDVRPVLAHRGGGSPASHTLQVMSEFVPWISSLLNRALYPGSISIRFSRCAVLRGMHASLWQFTILCSALESQQWSKKRERRRRRGCESVTPTPKTNPGCPSVTNINQDFCRLHYNLLGWDLCRNRLFEFRQLVYITEFINRSMHPK